jgi:hypothetical protein
MIKKNQIMSLAEADIYFLQNGATGFFDSNFPKSPWFEEPRIYQRYYFGMEINGWASSVRHSGIWGRTFPSSTSPIKGGTGKTIQT